MNKQERHEEIRDLLKQLSSWEQKYGTTYAAKPRLTSTGESNARITELKDKLVALGARFHWNGKEYVLDSVRQPRRGSQGPDERITKR